MARRSLLPERSVPVVRTCVGCKARVAKPDLLRVVGRGDEVLPDPQARLPGRGAYLHPCQRCFEQAVRRRAFARALRLPGPLVTGRLGEYLAREGSEFPSGQPGAPGPGGENGTARTAPPGKQGPIVMSAR